MYKNLNSKVLALCLNISYATTLLFLITSNISANVAIAANHNTDPLANDQPSGFLWYKDEAPIQQKKPQESANDTKLFGSALSHSFCFLCKKVILSGT